jgi:hypothetical protein
MEVLKIVKTLESVHKDAVKLEDIRNSIRNNGNLIMPADFLERAKLYDHTLTNVNIHIPKVIDELSAEIDAKIILMALIDAALTLDPRVIDYLYRRVYVNKTLL